MANKGEFEGELSIEPVLGVRMFVIDVQGRLRGVSYDEVWKPGENTARCYVTYDDAGEWEYDEKEYAKAVEYWTTTLADMNKYDKYDKYIRPPGKSDFRIPGTYKKKEHDPTNCSCGYYAFYTPSIQYMAPGRAWGVIEGYGKTTIGSKGFRAQKAKILGIALPDANEPMESYYQTLVRRNYKDIPFFDTLGALIREIPTTPEVAEDNEEFWNVPARQEEERRAKAAQGALRKSNSNSSLSQGELNRWMTGQRNPSWVAVSKPDDTIAKLNTEANLEQLKQASLEAKEARRKIGRKWFDV